MKTKKGTKKKENKSEAGKIFALSAGVAAVAAAGYFLFGPDGKKNRKMIKGWSLKMKGEVLEKLEKAKEVSEPVYNEIIDTVSQKYLSPENKKEVEKLAKELKKHWKAISANTKGNSKNGTARRQNKA